jgi:hypothetical protein
MIYLRMSKILTLKLKNLLIKIKKSKNLMIIHSQFNNLELKLIFLKTIYTKIINKIYLNCKVFKIIKIIFKEAKVNNFFLIKNP